MLITPLYSPLSGGAAIYTSMVTRYFQDVSEVETLFVLTEYVRNAPLFERRKQTIILRCLVPRLSHPITNPAMLWLTGLVSLFQVAFLVLLLRVDWIHWHNAAIVRARQIFSEKLKLCPVLLDVRDTSLPRDRYIGSDHYVASTQATYRHLLLAGIPHDAISYIPIPFEAPRPQDVSVIEAVLKRYGLEYAGPYVLCIGDLDDEHGQEELLAGFELLKAGHDYQLKLMLAGTDRSKGVIPHKVQHGKDSIYLGSVPYQDALALMQQATCVILPTKHGSFGRIILEAIALNTPVVCPPNVPEFAEHCPNFVLGEVSPQAIAAKLREVLETGEVARYPIDLHNSQECMKRLLDVYRKMDRMAKKQ